jgi:hypothetical protein
LVGGGAHSSAGAPATTAPGEPATGPTTTAAPAAVDVAAARACQAWDVYLTAALTGEVSAAQGQRLLTATEVLIAGASQDQAAGRPLPKWEELGGDIINAADDVVNGDAEALGSDGAAVAAQCKTIPAAADAAGGFVGSSL